MSGRVVTEQPLHINGHGFPAKGHDNKVDTDLHFLIYNR